MSQEANILIVDDDVRVSRVLARDLTSAGYRVKTADNGEEMHRCMQVFKPNLVILDLQMPGEHGLELARNFGRSLMLALSLSQGRGTK